MSGLAIGALGNGPANGIHQIIALRQQIIERTEVLQQIHAARGSASHEPAGIVRTGEVAGGFAATLKTAIDGVSATQERASSVMDAYQKGEVTDVAQVMLARQEAGVAFETTLQVRNKLLSAYQDIMRMGV